MPRTETPEEKIKRDKASAIVYALMDFTAAHGMMEEGDLVLDSLLNVVVALVAKLPLEHRVARMEKVKRQLDMGLEIMSEPDFEAKS